MLLRKEGRGRLNVLTDGQTGETCDTLPGTHWGVPKQSWLLSVPLQGAYLIFRRSHWSLELLQRLLCGVPRAPALGTLAGHALSMACLLGAVVLSSGGGDGTGIGKAVWMAHRNTPSAADPQLGCG